MTLLHLGFFYSFLNQVEGLIALLSCHNGLFRGLLVILFRFQLLLVRLDAFDVAWYSLLLLAHCGDLLSAALSGERCVGCLGLNYALSIELHTHLGVILSNTNDTSFQMVDSPLHGIIKGRLRLNIG